MRYFQSFRIFLNPLRPKILFGVKLLKGPKVNNCARVYRLEHNYIVRYISISTTCFGSYGHLQVGYEIRRCIREFSPEIF